MHQMGFRNTVAILGTGLSQRQVRIIDRLPTRRVFMLYDKDAAGVANVLDTESKLPRHSLGVCLYPSGKSDPAELTREQVERAMARAIPVHALKKRANPRRVGVS